MRSKKLVKNETRAVIDRADRLRYGTVGALYERPLPAWALFLFWVLLLACAPAFAQGRGQRGAPQAAKAIAPVDFTGYWVSVVSEDWRHRMTTPRKGDYESLPLNAEGRRVADTWDLTKDNQAGLQCKAFGIGGIMRQPGRIHITWQDDNTLKIDFDAGRIVIELPHEVEGEG